MTIEGVFLNLLEYIQMLDLVYRKYAHLIQKMDPLKMAHLVEIVRY